MNGALCIRQMIRGLAPQNNIEQILHSKLIGKKMKRINEHSFNWPCLRFVNPNINLCSHLG